MFSKGLLRRRSTQIPGNALRKKAGRDGFDGGVSCFFVQDSHVHDVRFMQRLVFDLWVDDGRVGDPGGVGTRGAGHHVV